MKKALIITAALFMLGLANPIKAQDCEAIIDPYLTTRGFDPATYPADKMDYFCRVSQNAFYMVNTLPNDAIVYNLHDVTDKISGKKIPKNFIVDLTTFSFWGYNFMDFQVRHKNATIYYRLSPNNSARYLAVRNYGEALERTNFPERFINGE